MLSVERNINKRKKVLRTTKVLKEFYRPDLLEKEYAILSHCWGVEKEGEQEVLFEDMNRLLIVSDEEREEIRRRTGYKKIIDTCCIDKKSSSELSEAINSMYKWYADAALCYAYLHDTVWDSWVDRSESMTIPKWFSRGWTLQELIAPKTVHFFDQKWKWIGGKPGLAWILSKFTGIPDTVLRKGLKQVLSNVNDYAPPSVARTFSWAARRKTTREEDRAYSLLGLLQCYLRI
ncbi:hypothetical protein EDC04DRAFT_2570327 [Pisolithus marmoratus]|nr:hypothetical protein EDC04DRAFT_2570327 [Pisolithus marmoratus]